MRSTFAQLVMKISANLALACSSSGVPSVVTKLSRSCCGRGPTMLTTIGSRAPGVEEGTEGCRDRAPRIRMMQRYFAFHFFEKLVDKPDEVSGRQSLARRELLVQRLPAHTRSFRDMRHRDVVPRFLGQEFACGVER